MQRAHFLEAGGTVGEEEVAVQCGLPGGFEVSGNLVDLRPYPNVLECTVTIAEPGVRVFAVDESGMAVDPPAPVELLDFFDGSISALTCSPEDVDGSPSLFCDSPPSGEYEVVAPDGTQVSCAPQLLGFTEVLFTGDSVRSSPPVWR